MSEQFFYKQDTLPKLTEDTPAPTPTHIGPYKIESLLSKGGMSFLYLGTHPDSKQPLAIKILSPNYISNELAVERFLKEAHIISLSNHPNIVKLYGEGKWEKGLYIAMEWIRGISLRQFIMQQSLSLRRALDIILQVAYALHHLHSHGIIHRDLKPENILITEEGGVKVIDFGIAQFHQNNNSIQPIQKQGIMGTLNYMSPEQKEDASLACFASDIYSLAIIAFELITGKLSYGVIHTSLLPKGLEKILEKALAISIDERYQTISAFINEISAYLDSGEMDKQKSGNDLVKEIIEAFQKTSQLLSGFPHIDPSQIEIGIAKYKLATQFSLYSDLLKLPNGSFLFLLAESTISSPESLAYAANIRGLIRSQIYVQSQDIKQSWDLVKMAQVLNEMLTEDPAQLKYGLSALLLNPMNEQLYFFNAGMNHLIHISQEGHSHILSSSNPLLGAERNPDFTQVVDNWNIADTIILHSLAPLFRTDSYQQNQTEKILLDSLEDNPFLSAQPQSEALLKKALFLSFQKDQKQAKILISIQRIS